MTERFKEFHGDGEVQHVELTSLLSEAKDKDKNLVAELFQEFSGEGDVQHEVLANLLSEAKDKEEATTVDHRCATAYLTIYFRCPRGCSNPLPTPVFLYGLG